MINVETIHRLAGRDRIAFKRHTVFRMHQRKIFADEVKAMLLKCELIEDYPDDYPLPSGLVFGYTKQNRPIHAVAALGEDAEMIWLITVYEPTLEEWENGFKKRRIKDEMPAV